MSQRMRYLEEMSEREHKISLDDPTGPQMPEADDRDYASWKESKIRKALKQSEDRSVMTPARNVWERFGFER